MDVQQLSAKVYAAPGHSVAQDEYIPLFHAWIRDRRVAPDKLLIDVADYKHVHHGPGIMLVGHEAHWSMDEAGGELGMAYHRKRDPIGPAQPKLEEALRDLLEAAVALEQEPSLSGRLTFEAARLSFRITSKLAADNNAQNRAAWEQELRVFLDRVAPTAALRFVHDETPSACVGATVTLDGGPGLRAMHAALAG